MNSNLQANNRRYACAMLALSGALGSALAAHASVSTAVQIYASYSGESMDRAYNPAQIYGVPGPDSLKPGDTGLYTCHPSYCTPVFPNVVTSGTTDTTGAASSAYDSLSGVDPSTNSSAYASATANTAHGALHDTAFGSYEFPYGGDDYDAAGNPGGSIFDDVTFNVAGANNNTVTDIAVDYRLTGSVSGLTFNHGENVSTAWQFQLGNTEVSQTGGWASYSSGPNALGVGILRQNYGAPPVSLLGVNVIADTPTDVDLQFDYQITGSSVSTGYYDGLALSCSGVTCDYGSRFSFVLPTGVTITSASGIIPSAAAPEPGTWTLMLVGFGALGGALRRRASRGAKWAAQSL